MPAWQRYNGHFYQPAASALKAAVSNSAHIVIISGGYGLVRAEENICDYERKLRCSDWPNHVIEEALVNEAIRVGAKNVVAFAPRTSQYAKVIKRTRWGSVGPQRALLVTHESHVRVGQSEVLRDLGSAFSCFWNNKLEAFPDNVKVKELM